MVRICAYCGHLTSGPGPLCSYHIDGMEGADWARGNRLMCDFVHRGIVAPPLRRPASSSFDVPGDLDTALVA
jgi:hypothetical protein